MTPAETALSHPNVRAFLAFRLLFSARFYYPIFTILFLDYGLSLEEFSLLNVVWATTIVLAEVPSGALADLVGRRRLVVLAAVLMVVELAVIGFVPLGEHRWVLGAFLVNRVCSGLAEAAASGADEALAYDSLADAGLAAEWPAVLERLGKLSSLAFFVAMLTGAAVYDLGLVNGLLERLGSSWRATRPDLLRVPVWLTLVTACLALVSALRLREERPASSEARLSALGAAFGQVARTGRWILGAPFVLLVILAGLALDSVARQFVLLGSEYYRGIEVPTYLLGPLGAGAALLGYVSSAVCRRLVASWRPSAIFALLTALLAGALVGASLGVRHWGVAFALGPFLTLSAVGFLQSHYLNAHVDSARRATVLSFKGLALNVGMGTASVLYAALLRGLGAGPVATREEFFQALGYFAPYCGALALALVLGGAWLLRSQGGPAVAESEPVSEPEPGA